MLITPLTIRILICCISLLATAAVAEPIIIPEVNLNPKRLKPRATDEKPETTRIDREKIANSPTVDLSELLKQEQSVARITNNSGNYSQMAVSIRGFGDNAVANSLIMVDGFPLTNPSLLAPNFNSIILPDIERIDITQGSDGVLWGDQSVGGTVNIVTRYPKKLTLNANLGLGSFNNQIYSIFAADQFNNGVFLKAFGYTNKTNNYREHNYQTNENLSTMLGYHYATGSLFLNLQKYENSIQFPGGLSKEQYEEDPRLATNFKNNIHFKTPLVQIFNKQIINDKWTLETRLAHQKTLGDGYMYSAFNREDSMNTYGTRLTGLLGKMNLLAGYEGQTSFYDFSNLKVEENSKANQNDLFARAKIPIKQWEMIFGARAAMQKNHFSPAQNIQFQSLNKTLVTEEGITFNPSEDWQFLLRRSGNFRFPKANEETWLPQGVDSLELQTGISYEFSAQRKTKSQKSQINIYQLELNNEIAFNPTQTPTEPFGSYSNFPKTLRRGITFSEDYIVNPKLMLNSQINYVHAYFAQGEFSGKSIPAVPKWNGNIGLGYELIPHWKIKYSALYTGQTYASQDDNNSGEKVASYWLNTIAFQYLKKSVNMSLDAVNIFNQKYSVYTLYDPESQTNTYYPGSGRSILFTIKVDVI